MTSVFRPRFSRFLAGTIGVLCAVGLLGAVLQDGATALWQVGPWVLLVAGLIWATYWNPLVSIDDAGVHVVNVLRTIDVTWPTIQRVDTKWALTLVTEFGTVTAWAAPAPGGIATARGASRSSLRGLPESTYGPGQSIRPGDVPSSTSGAAAAVVRRRWEELRDAGHLDGARPEHDRLLVTWHWPVIVGVPLVAACCAASVLLG